MYTTYILLCDKAHFYVGLTTGMPKRLLEHRSGYSPHTKRYKLIDLVYSENFSTRARAEAREKQLKGWSKAKKRALVAGDKTKLIELSKSKS